MAASFEAKVHELRTKGAIDELREFLIACQANADTWLSACCALAEEALQHGDKTTAQNLIAELSTDFGLEPNVIRLRSKLLAESGDLEGALCECDRGLAVHADSLPLLEFKGLALVAKGDLEAAEATALTAIAISKSDPHTLRVSANLLLHTNRFSQAFQLAKQATEADSSSILAYFLLGCSAIELNQLDIAEQALTRAIKMKPGFKKGLIKLAETYNEQFRFQECNQALQSALKIAPITTSDYMMLGNSWRELGDLDKAEESYYKTLELDPNSASAKSSLGITCQLRNKMEESIGHYMMAVLDDPGHVKAHVNLGLALLLLGDYKSGWDEYEWRRIALPIDPAALQGHPRLEDANKSIDHLLITVEQGIGDTIHFIRYASYFKERGSSVHLIAPSKVHSLALQTGLIDSAEEWVENILPLPGTWEWIPIMSLPRVLNITRDEPMYTTPYIPIPEGSYQHWQTVMRPSDGAPVIGVHWQGNPEAERTTLRGRSIPLQTLAPLFDINDSIRWVSLQKGYGKEQMDAFTYRDKFIDCQSTIDETWDFVETGAIMKNCDLIITNDTSAAHLAGAIGRPVWLLLTLVPDWRWGLEGDTTAWYPSMRLFRQREFGNWDDVISRVGEALTEYLQNLQTR